MRKLKLFVTVAIVVAALTTTTDIFAQRGQGRGYANNAVGQGRFYANRTGTMVNDADRPYYSGQCILNLTPEQNEKITQLRTTHLQDMTQLHNELNVKRAQLRSLQAVNNPNLNEINSIIDEMGAIRTKIQKSSATHRASVASNLTDEQKAVYNTRRGTGAGRGAGVMGRGGRGARGGRGGGMGGRGMGCGMGW
ncbi:MAG: periplasmic heavy metal sensor [Tenuifilaceae bacterium]|nr:periplasmic heavy metal sensor [Tenuifilaceae bacterium]